MINGTSNFIMKTYVLFILHTQINFNCKQCIIAVVLIISQFTSMYMPKNLENTPAQVLNQLCHTTWNMRRYGFSLTVFSSIRKDFVLIRENTGQWKPVFSHILCSAIECFNQLRNWETIWWLQHVVLYYGTVHFVKSVCIRSFSGSYFPAFGLNTD